MKLTAEATATDRRRFLYRSAIGTLGLLSSFGTSSSASVFGTVSASGNWESANGLKPSGDAVKPDLYFHPGDPRNAEPMLPRLVESWLTPVSQFYIRSHAANPVIDPLSWRLSIEGMIERPVQLSLNELTGRFAKTSCTCTLTCAGNRRNEFSKVKTVGGVQWQEGAIGNAVWSGIRLSEVLKSAGLMPGAKHVWFDGLDQIQDGDQIIPFGGSVPLSKVFEEDESAVGTLLATHMNGEPLTSDHGAPLRTVVPGYIGARSVKWLGRIVVSDRPSPNHYVDDVYKILEVDTPVQRDEAIPIYRYPVNSAICSTELMSNSGTWSLKGYALSHGNTGARISRVEVSADGGKSWQQAQLGTEDQQFCWRLWSLQMKAPTDVRAFIVRAIDSQDHHQPQSVRWNPKGYLFNAWHSVSPASRGGN